MDESVCKHRLSRQAIRGCGLSVFTINARHSNPSQSKVVEEAKLDLRRLRFRPTEDRVPMSLSHFKNFVKTIPQYATVHAPLVASPAL